MNFKFSIALFLSLTLLTLSLKAQQDSAKTETTKPKNVFIKKAAIPSVLIISGLSLNRSVFEKNLNRDLRNKVGNDYEFRIDDYIQYAPIAEMYIADALGIKAKNHWFDQTKNLAFSNLFTAIVIHSIKRGMNKTRPNGSGHSFPSGHTATAFTGATVLFQEFKETNSVLAYSGFAFATTTGTFRMINNAHWFSDVLAGAGISILMTNIVYQIEPLKNWNPFKKNNNVSLIPYFNENETGIYLTKRF
ncbi:phosphatase PAP2 family protein [Vicingus serpentipes]|uniref:Phosphatase PAP2 family protein n=1 Tax=Vicingus serpentipes TaxID=1926625 RepID=A0A5C6RN77_9FLAO|nr:phosphatase PAP2 family protein [Vicingus serpentipes]TXB63683.1 phosphatase PAP2 family protein [Vicingus serpentipes]